MRRLLPYLAPCDASAGKDGYQLQVMFDGQANDASSSPLSRSACEMLHCAAFPCWFGLMYKYPVCGPKPSASPKDAS